MVRCGYCDSELLPESDDHVVCYGCENHYCFRCSVKETTYRNMTEDKRKAWRCQYKCKGKTVSSNKSGSQPVDIGLGPNADSDIKVMLKSLITKMDGFETILNGVKDSQAFISDKYDTLLTEIRELKQQNKHLGDEMVGLKRTISDRDHEIESLKVQLNDLDQYGRRFNLEISGVQDAGKVDTMVILEKLAGQIDVPFNKDQIQAAHPLKQNNTDRPPTLIVQFTRKDVRDQWIVQGKKTFKEATPGPTKTYFNENLTPANRLLHKETRVRAKANGYSFVWVKNAKILVRKDATASLLHIKCKADLAKLGNAPVSRPKQT